MGHDKRGECYRLAWLVYGGMSRLASGPNRAPCHAFVAFVCAVRAAVAIH